MNKSNLIKIAAGVAFIFSALTVLEGSLVYLKISFPEYRVFVPLLLYNIAMGVVGLFVALKIWNNQIQALRYSLIVASVHVTIFFIMTLIYFTNDVVAFDSVKAMVLRSLIWLAVSFVVFKNKKSK